MPNIQKCKKPYHTAKNVNERFTELQQKEAMLNRIGHEIPMIEKKEQQLAEAERAVTIEEIERQLTALKKKRSGKQIILTTLRQLSEWPKNRWKLKNTFSS